MKEQTKNTKPAELRQARKAFGLSGSEFAEVIQLKSGCRQVCRWETGEASIPGSVLVLVNILKSSPEARQILGLRLPQDSQAISRGDI